MAEIKDSECWGGFPGFLLWVFQWLRRTMSHFLSSFSWILQIIFHLFSHGGFWNRPATVPELASGTQPSPKLEDTGGKGIRIRGKPRELHHSVIWKAMKSRDSQSVLDLLGASCRLKSLHHIVVERMIFQTSSSTELITCDENLVRLLFPADLQCGFGPIL